MLDYFHAQGMTESYEALLHESKADFAPEPKTKYSGLLEKKWTSVIRLQKKVCTLFQRPSAEHCTHVGVLLRHMRQFY
jgi:platelet-activating factor acetylhydrolase IB subunit alpha